MEVEQERVLFPESLFNFEFGLFSGAKKARRGRNAWSNGKRKERKKERSRYWRRVRGPDIGTPTFIVTNDTAVNSPLTPSRVGSSKQERTCPFSALSFHSSSFFFFPSPPPFFFFSCRTFRLSLFRYREAITKFEYDFELKNFVWATISLD